MRLFIGSRTKRDNKKNYISHRTIKTMRIAQLLAMRSLLSQCYNNHANSTTQAMDLNVCLHNGLISLTYGNYVKST